VQCHTLSTRASTSERRQAMGKSRVCYGLVL
jgi:hypothetical protein